MHHRSTHDKIQSIASQPQLLCRLLALLASLDAAYEYVAGMHRDTAHLSIPDDVWHRDSEANSGQAVNDIFG